MLKMLSKQIPGRVVRFLSLTALPTLCLLLAGCVTHSQPGQGAQAQRFAVILPPVHLETGEIVESVSVKIVMGRIVSLDHLRYDWNYTVSWENADFVTLEEHARHFSSGQCKSGPLADLITVEPTSTEPIQVSATLKLRSTDPTGRPPRKLHFAGRKIVLRPVPNSTDPTGGPRRALMIR